MARRKQPEDPDEIRHKTIEAYRDCFTTEAGKAVLRDMRASYQMQESFIPGDHDQTAYREGQRAVYLHILRLVEAGKNGGRDAEHTAITSDDTEPIDAD